jgi:hypothetical protein
MMWLGLISKASSSKTQIPLSKMMKNTKKRFRDFISIQNYSKKATPLYFNRMNPIHLQSGSFPCLR